MAKFKKGNLIIWKEEDFFTGSIITYVARVDKVDNNVRDYELSYLAIVGEPFFKYQNDIIAQSWLNTRASVISEKQLKTIKILFGNYNEK